MEKDFETFKSYLLAQIKHLAQKNKHPAIQGETNSKTLNGEMFMSSYYFCNHLFIQFQNTPYNGHTDALPEDMPTEDS